TPCAMLVLVHTTHFMNSRYIIATLPMVLVTAVIGVPALLPGALRAARPSAWRAICAAIMALLLVLHIQGIPAYSSGSNPAGPLKPDWRGATRLFRQSAGLESCLVTVDGIGDAVSEVIPYYLEDPDGIPPCTVEARDPRLLTIVERHPDLWLAIETG